MDNFLKAMDRLAAIAAGAEKAPGLNPAAVMECIARLPAEQAREGFPIRLFMGIGASAVAAAAVVAAIAFPAWLEIAHPLAGQAILPDVTSFLR